MSKTHSVSISNEELNEYLEGKENKSAFIKAALTWRMNQEKEIGDLTDEQREAYQWLNEREITSIRLDAAKNELAQQTNKNENLVMSDIIKPLVRKEYLFLKQGVNSVSLMTEPL